MLPQRELAESDALLADLAGGRRRHLAFLGLKSASIEN